MTRGIRSMSKVVVGGGRVGVCSLGFFTEYFLCLSNISKV